MASKYDIDPNLIGIIMTVESGGNPNAKSNKDALGLMQITPPRAQDIAQKFISPAVPSYDLKDPMTNIEFGAANIRQLIKEYGEADQGPFWDETVQLVAAGYNGGEGAANQFKKSGLTALNQETYSYVRYVSNMWRERHDNKSFTLYYWRNIAHGEKLLKAAEKYKM